jgi:putative aldouronate transport system permease protein
MKQTEIKMREPHAKNIWKAVVKDWRLYVLLLPLVIWFAIWGCRFND